MKETFGFTDIDGKTHAVEFSIIQTEADYRTYGIRACLITDGEVTESKEATERFITLPEAEATVKMLQECEVMPSTLCQIL